MICTILEAFLSILGAMGNRGRRKFLFPTQERALRGNIPRPGKEQPPFVILPGFFYFRLCNSPAWGGDAWLSERRDEERNPLLPCEKEIFLAFQGHSPVLAGEYSRADKSRHFEQISGMFLAIGKQVMAYQW